MIAGIIPLLLGPSALAEIVKSTVSPESPLVNGIFSFSVVTVWKQSPSIFINVVLATFFLGQAIPGWRIIWQQASPQAAFGQALGWGQYVVGLLLTIAVLTPIFNLPPVVGSLIEVGF
ncbi:Sodium/glutamate symporter [Richelia intracellularis]|nr:Sodium/glutamate symporter [Richelia intracellularis]